MSKLLVILLLVGCATAPRPMPDHVNYARDMVSKTVMGSAIETTNGGTFTGRLFPLGGISFNATSTATMLFAAGNLTTAGMTFVQSDTGQMIQSNGSNPAFYGPNGGIILGGKISGATNFTSCTLNAGSPSTCTATVTAGAKCNCTPTGTTAAIAAGGCATNVASTTVTATGPNAAAYVANIICDK